MTNGVIPHITRCEQLILDELIKGLSDKAIAERLHLGEQTVKNHLTHVRKRFAVKGRKELALVGQRYCPTCGAERPPKS